MVGTNQHHARAIGEKIRVVRQEHKLTLRELARKTDMSASMLSMIETGKVFPSVRSLYSIAAALGVAVDHFFPEQDMQPTEEGVASLLADDLTASELRAVLLTRNIPDAAEFTRPMSSTPIVHADGRPTIRLNGGATWARLTALAEKDTEFLEINYAPGAASGVDMSHHGGREFGLILEGELTIELGFESYRLEAGDSIIFESTTPHRLSNKSAHAVRAIWIIFKIG